MVQLEQPDLESQKQELQQAFNRYQIQLVQLEDDLLESLANAPDDILSDVPLIEGLEATKVGAVFTLQCCRLIAPFCCVCCSFAHAIIFSPLTYLPPRLLGVCLRFPLCAIANRDGDRRGR